MNRDEVWRIPAGEWTERHVCLSRDIKQLQWLAFRFVGCTNATEFRGHRPAEVMLIGCNGKAEGDRWFVDFHFGPPDVVNRRRVELAVLFL